MMILCFMLTQPVGGIQKLLTWRAGGLAAEVLEANFTPQVAQEPEDGGALANTVFPSLRAAWRLTTRLIPIR